MFSEIGRDLDRLSDPDLCIPDLVEEILVVDSDRYDVDRLNKATASDVAPVTFLRAARNLVSFWKKKPIIEMSSRRYPA